MVEDKRLDNNGEHSKPLEELAKDNEKLLEGTLTYPSREDRGRHVDVHALRELMYALHSVSIGTHQLLYFSAMKYCKNYFDAHADTLEEAVQDLAEIFDAMNIGTLRLRDKDDKNTVMLELDENALTFESDTDKPICYFISGYIAGYLENALGDHFVVNETSCTSQGHESCAFKTQKR